MKRILVILLVVFQWHAIAANQIDSTIVQKVDSMVAKVKSIWYTDLDSAKLMTNQLLEFSRENNYKKGEARAYNVFGVIYDIHGNLDQSIAYYKKSFEIFLELDDGLGLADTQYNMALLLQNDEQFEEALEYVQKARQYYISQELKSKIAMSTMTLGNLYLTNNKSLEEAIEKMKEAEQIAEEINDTLMISYD